MRLAMCILVLALASCSQDHRLAEEEPIPSLPTSSVEMTSPGNARATVPPRISGRYSPRDECTGLPDWAAFADSLRTAVRNRDARALAALAREDIRLDFGGGMGKEELIRRLNDRSSEDLWQELDRLLVLGCGKEDGGQTASLPWFWAQDLGQLDPYEVRFVVGSNVPLLSAPNAQAEPVALLTWTLVQSQIETDTNSPYMRVRVVDRDEIGFVEGRFLRSPLDYRVITNRNEEGWRITHLIAGD